MSTYGIRLKTNDNDKYYNWYIENETKLEELYEQEYCYSMIMSFDQWTFAIFKNNFQIQYY